LGRDNRLVWLASWLRPPIRNEWIDVNLSMENYMSFENAPSEMRCFIDAPGLDLEWQMTTWERFALQGLLRRLQPSLSLEIGTYKGGSLQVLSCFSKSVISVDIDPEVAIRLGSKFPNVEFRSGESAQVVPHLVREINMHKKPLAFVLVDGDHKGGGVRRDIEALLELKPQQQVVLVLHDSFNPGCREGMRKANWAKSPFVNYVELDFIPGVYHYDSYDTADPRSMWGGFACAVLLPQPRSGKLEIKESQRGLHEAVKRNSRHRFDGAGRLKRGLMQVVDKIGVSTYL